MSYLTLYTFCLNQLADCVEGSFRQAKRFPVRCIMNNRNLMLGMLGIEHDEDKGIIVSCRTKKSLCVLFRLDIVIEKIHGLLSVAIKGSNGIVGWDAHSQGHGYMGKFTVKFKLFGHDHIHGHGYMDMVTVMVRVIWAWSQL